MFTLGILKHKGPGLHVQECTGVPCTRVQAGPLMSTGMQRLHGDKCGYQSEICAGARPQMHTVFGDVFPYGV